MPTPHPSGNPISSNSGIMNDSSVAAVFIPNGEKTLFFHDHRVKFRQATLSLSGNRWSQAVTDLEIPVAKIHAPLVATYGNIGQAVPSVTSDFVLDRINPMIIFTNSFVLH